MKYSLVTVFFLITNAHTHTHTQRDAERKQIADNNNNNNNNNNSGLLLQQSKNMRVMISQQNQYNGTAKYYKI